MFLTLLGALIMPCVVIFFLGIVLFVAAYYYPARPFDRETWLNEPDRRYELADDLIDRKILLGKTKSEVKELLGDNSNPNTIKGEAYQVKVKDDDDSWDYYIGYKPRPVRIDSDGLHIDFQDGKVVGVYLEHE